MMMVASRDICMRMYSLSSLGCWGHDFSAHMVQHIGYLWAQVSRLELRPHNTPKYLSASPPLPVEPIPMMIMPVPIAPISIAFLPIASLPVVPCAALLLQHPVLQHLVLQHFGLNGLLESDAAQTWLAMPKLSPQRLPANQYPRGMTTREPAA